LILDNNDDDDDDVIVGAGGEFIFGEAALYSPQEATLALSNRGLMATVGGGAVPFLLSSGFAVLSLSLSYSSFHDRCHRVLMCRRLCHGLTKVFVS